MSDESKLSVNFAKKHRKTLENTSKNKKKKKCSSLTFQCDEKKWLSPFQRNENVANAKQWVFVYNHYFCSMFGCIRTWKMNNSSEWITVIVSISVSRSRHGIGNNFLILFVRVCNIEIHDETFFIVRDEMSKQRLADPVIQLRTECLRTVRNYKKASLQKQRNRNFSKFSVSFLFHE